jgi:hypothetical protein
MIEKEYARDINVIMQMKVSREVKKQCSKGFVLK